MSLLLGPQYHLGGWQTVFLTQASKASHRFWLADSDLDLSSIAPYRRNLFSDLHIAV